MICHLQDGKTPMETLLSWQKGVKNILNNFNEEEAPKPDEQLLFWMFSIFLSFFLSEQYFSISVMMTLIAGNRASEILVICKYCFLTWGSGTRHEHVWVVGCLFACSVYLFNIILIYFLYLWQHLKNVHGRLIYWKNVKKE